MTHPTAQSPRSPGRNVQLDALRGVAIVLVLLSHGPLHWDDAGHLRGLVIESARMGWTGVDLFFVLSGFLIGGLLINELVIHGRIAVGRFLVRRGLKLWPGYLALIAFWFVKLHHHGQGWGGALRQLVPTLLQVQNYTGAIIQQTWSLAVEEHFYLMLPVLMAVLAARRSRAGGADALAHRMPGLVACGVAVMAGCLVFRIVFHFLVPFNFRLHYQATHVRMDSLFLGVLLAYFWRVDPRLPRWAAAHRRGLALAGLALVSPMLFLDLGISPFIHTFGFTFLAWGYGCLLLAAIASPVRVPVACGAVGAAGRAATRALAFVGTYSYSIYLWHLDLAHRPVQHWPHALFDRLPPTTRFVVYMACYLAVAIVVGVALGKLIEYPALRLRERWFPARSAALAASGAPVFDASGPGARHGQQPPPPTPQGQPALAGCD
jgi:peptidoglycan/LPS O-acetylase OafA/YrhL